MLSAEALIRDRLAAATHRRVVGRHDIDSTEKRAQLAPALAVVYGGYRSLGRSGRRHQLEVTWYVVVIARNPRDASDGEAVRADASAMINEVVAALDGWAPSSQFSELELANPGARPRWDGATYLFPLAFRETHYLVGATCE